MPVELSDSYETIYQRAIEQMSIGNAEQAIESLWRIVNRLTRLRPETLQRKQKLQTTLTTTWESLVQFLRWEKRYAEAISACEQVIDHLPPDEDANRRIASLTIEQGQVEEGLARMRQIAEEKADFISWADLGAEHTALKQYEEAESCYQSALAVAKSNQEAAIANTGLFRVYSETGRVDDALSAWSMIVVLNPDFGEHVAEVYTWLIERGEFELAEKYLNREREATRRTFYQGMLDWHAGREENARSRWRRVLNMDIHDQDTDVVSWMEAALRLGEAERAVTAEHIFTEQDRPIAINEAIMLGIAFATLGNIQRAKEWLDQVVLRLQRGWPSRQKIDHRHWKLLNQVSDPETVENLSDYFDIGEN